MRPDPRGHSISKVLLEAPVRSRSPSRAQAVTRLPPRWVTSPKGHGSPAGISRPVSSPNSRRAAARASAPSSYSPFGMDQTPSSFLAQKGPPGWAKSTSTPAVVER